MVKFGPAGNSDSFEAQGYKSSLDAPKYLHDMGLDAFEYQCGRGVRISQASAAKLGEKAREYGITLSIHAPYFISMSSVEEEKRLGSLRYILDSAAAAKAMGAKRVILHTGSCGKISREEALVLAKDTMKLALNAMDEGGYSDIHLCPEVMGKINQLGTLEEVLELCTLDERLIPCVDFGHLNARTFGGLGGYEDFKAVFDAMENRLGTERMRNFHSHFSKIEYTPKGGEKKHLTFEDTVFGPDFRPVAQLLAERKCTATIICESAGTQAEDAVIMQQDYRRAKEALEQGQPG
ncbi:TIM barrel protein [Oscillospiraceae bacterium MB08-C2-2]|nr:TIM barrel protein [Oscillospiraceae bacterium MB08-C2-2]